MMSQIESAVVLPEGASPIDHYSRNYTLRPDGEVVAVYLIPPDPTEDYSEDYGCEIALAGLESRPCAHEGLNEVKRSDANWAAAYGVAGESRWFDGDFIVPTVSDSGCAVIDIVFDPHAQQVENVECGLLFDGR